MPYFPSGLYPSTPTSDPGVLVSHVKSHLVGVQSWLLRAAQSDIGYDDTEIARLIPQMIRQWEQETQIRVNPVQVIGNNDGTIAATTGNTMPDGVTEIVRDSAYDWHNPDVREYFKLSLREKPVQSIDRIQIKWPNTSDVILTIPANWISLNTRSGRVEIIPYAGTAQYGNATVALSVIQLGFGGRNYIPGIITVDYKAGLPSGWSSIPTYSRLLRSLEEYCAYAVLCDIAELYYAGHLNIRVDDGMGMGQTFNLSRFEKRKEELLSSVMRFQQTWIDTETPFLLAAL